ncbi:MAG: GNAT family N-acetyltransferase [Bacteroidota bacterium]|nr:GNAT family N-acetyltransferase [Bacteroidota bacterium]
MIEIKRTDSGNHDFIDLVKLLDTYLAEMDGENHSFYDQFNKVENIKYVVVAYENNLPAGCGAIKEFTSKVMEVKRMYTKPGNRRRGIAAKVLNELEDWAAEMSSDKCVLETGKRQQEAIEFYRKNGYSVIPNYGQYAAMENSLCFEKKLR